MVVKNPAQVCAGQFRTAKIRSSQVGLAQVGRS
jgi:hypothetical protein